MSNMSDMNKAIKGFFNRLDVMLENDKDIEVNSTDELIKKANEYLEKQR